MRPAALGDLRRPGREEASSFLLGVHAVSLPPCIFVSLCSVIEPAAIRVPYRLALVAQIPMLVVFAFLAVIAIVPVFAVLAVVAVVAALAPEPVFAALSLAVVFAARSVGAMARVVFYC